MKNFNEKDLKQALESKDKNVVIDFALQYKFEKDFFESQYNLYKEAFILAIHNLACLMKESLNEKRPSKEEVEILDEMFLSTASKVIEDKNEE